MWRFESSRAHFKPDFRVRFFYFKDAHGLRYKELEEKYTYIGMSSELEVRLNRHNEGKNITTSAYSPFKLIYTKSFETRTEARQYEKYLKSGVGREFLKSIES